ncbi:Glycosyltransferase involved in cell wall bisynthesis [Kaistella chaponensis]|uniref:Glycosyltransferase involved in cell wall bisynthesis n=1 Tax=Kaistella chaponensis TaxID=713588 RepID=A0A1N7JPL9_9FLAO|nr:glycosyltransferase [Kaistella chaponensis]SIS51201.1 Glycosyltransferase involved in cell wall bisynthesis [Kaistella chaponensis]
MKKKILYFMPDNPVSGKAGNLTRASQMLHYLQRLSSNYDVDFLSIGDWGDWDEINKEKFVSQYPNVNLHLINRKGSKTNKLKAFFQYKLLNIIPKLLKGTSIDITNPILRNKVKNFINKEKYDIIIISYASWAQVIDGISKGPYLIIDTHDFITAQSRKKTDKIGKLFQNEIQILRKFDEIWTYSVEEEYIFEQFTDKKVTLIPVSFPLNFNKEKRTATYDVIYVASKNPHNIAGINWFLKEVLPFLRDVKIHIIGRICSEIGDYENVVKYGMVDDLDDFYRNSRVAICPMLSGTGIKIKVIEALSYGIPVVTNRRGVDGLVNKKENGCLVSDDPKIFAEDINRLLTDQIFYDRTKNEAISYFQNNHDPKLEEALMNKIFK